MTPEFVAGDVFYTLSNQEYQLFKVLAVDHNLEAYHVRAYMPQMALPTVANWGGPVKTDSELR